MCAGVLCCFFILLLSPVFLGCFNPFSGLVPFLRLSEPHRDASRPGMADG